ncbi:MAG TPA: hypothetical protein VJV78_03910 [Polyangiales bacterium]|nr:hypothetical protein [Polyangiales bacterium]
MQPETVNETLVLPFPDPITAATEFRSTWLTSSLEGLRHHGHFERYVKLLASHREEILTSVAASWVPIAVARAHYDACELLALDADQIDAMARAGGSVRRAWYATAIAGAQRTPSMRTVLVQLQKFWLRSANGGAVQVVETSEHSARLHYVGCELFDVAYFREALRVVLLLLFQHVHEDSSMTVHPFSATELEFRLHWHERR